MTTGRILLAAVTGTTAMTLFSYQASRLEKEQFREPQLLNNLIKRLVGNTKFPLQDIGGWAVHYMVGTVFVVVYDKLWRGKLRPSLLTGMFVGAVSGLIGMAGWHAVIRLHPDPPSINPGKYYPHLLAAHVVFGAFAAMGYKLSKQDITHQRQNSTIAFTSIRQKKSA